MCLRKESGVTTVEGEGGARVLVCGTQLPQTAKRGRSMR